MSVIHTIIDPTMLLVPPLGYICSHLVHILTFTPSLIKRWRWCCTVLLLQLVLLSLMSVLAQMSFHALPLSSSLLTCCPHRWCPPCCCLIIVVLIVVASLFLSSTLLSCCCCLITVVLLHLPHLCGLNVSVMVPVLPPCHCFDRTRSVG